MESSIKNSSFETQFVSFKTEVKTLDGCLFVCLFVYVFVFFCFNLRRIPTGSFPQNFVKIQLDLADILRISKLDWRDGGGGKKEGRREGGEESYSVMV